MGYIIDFLINWGYWGMLVSAFLAGSFFPFSSEVVMSGLQAAGLDPIPLVIYGSIGNVLGSLFNYGVGRLGKMEWIEKYLHVKKEKLDQAERFMADRGAWMGFFAFIPILDSSIFYFSFYVLTSNLYYAFSCSCLNAFLSSIKKNGKYRIKSINTARIQTNNNDKPPWKNAVTNPGVTQGIAIVGLILNVKI